MWIEILNFFLCILVFCVAPFAGVWIEITCNHLQCYNSLSHPSRVCGLKSVMEMILNGMEVSHPSRVCGLKSSFRLPFDTVSIVAPFAGVWIEIAIAV